MLFLLFGPISVYLIFSVCKRVYKFFFLKSVVWFNHDIEAYFIHSSELNKHVRMYTRSNLCYSVTMVLFIYMLTYSSSSVVVHKFRLNFFEICDVI